jgi:tyrosine-protein phosphatase SIW14
MYITKNRGRRLNLLVLACCVLTQLAAVSNAREARVSGPRYDELSNFHQVNARLYRGGQPRRKGGIQRLAALGVNTVINLRDDDERAIAEGLEVRAAGLRYFNIPFGRLGRPTDEQVDQVLSLIEAPESGVVFVHCARGEDRTGVVIALYRISHDGWTSEQAKEEANRYGMKFWQRGMKNFIRDYYRDRATRRPPTSALDVLLKATLS